MAPPTDSLTEEPCAALLQDFLGHRVLIVDDDPFIRSVMVAMLEDTGLNLDEAPDGSSAVALCRQTCYSLILIDMVMPGMTGVEATLQIRQLPGMERTPILAITGNSSDKDRSNCLQAGMNDFVSKPISREALAAMVLRWLRRSPS